MMLEVARVSDQEVRECMADAGFDYPAAINVVADSMQRPSGSLSDRDWVEQYGFGVWTTPGNTAVADCDDPVAAFLASLSASERQALLDQLGEPGSGGCWDRGSERALRELGLEDVQVAYEDLPDLSKIPEVIAAEQEWSACAARAGVRSAGLLAQLAIAGVVVDRRILADRCNDGAGGGHSRDMRSVVSEREGRFEVVFRECLRDVKAYAASHVGRGDVDDVVSATFMSVWQRFDEVPWPSHRAWVLGVCRNHCRNRWRTDRRFAALVDEIMLARAVPSVEDASVGGIDTAAAVGAAIGSLSVDDRELLVLSAWMELSPSEIAEVLGIPAGRVRVRLHRLRAALGRELGQQEEGDLA